MEPVSFSKLSQLYQQKQYAQFEPAAINFLQSNPAHKDANQLLLKFYNSQSLFSKSAALIEQLNQHHPLPWIARESAELSKLQGQFDQAEAILRQAELDFPLNPWISEDLALLLFQQNRSDEAILHLEEQIDKKEPKDIVLLNIARLYFFLKQPEKAEPYCEKLVNSAGEKNYVIHFVINNLALHNRWQTIRELSEKIDLSSQPEFIKKKVQHAITQHTIEEATQLWNQNERSQAIQLLDDFCRTQDAHINAYIHLGYLYLSEHNYPLLETLIKQALEIAPEEEQVFRLRSKARINTYDYERGIEELTELTSWKPHWLWAKKELAEIYHFQNDFITSRKLLLEAIEQWPKYIEPYLLLSHISKLEGNINESIDILKKAWDQFRLPRAGAALANQLTESKRLDEASLVINELQELDDIHADPNVLAALASYAIAVEDFDEAKYWIESRETAFPSNQYNLTLRLNYHTNAGSYDDIFPILEEKLLTEKHKPEFIEQYLYHCTARGKKAKAMALIDLAENEHGENSHVMTRVATTLFKMGKNDQALNRFMCIDPINVYQEINLQGHIALVHSDSFDFTRALEHYSRAIELNKRAIWIIERRAFCYMMTHQWDNARADLDAIIEIKKQTESFGKNEQVLLGLFGDFWDEFSINPPLMKQLSERPPLNAADVLTLIEQEPGSSLLYFHLLIQLRLDGTLKAMAGSPGQNPEPFPKNIFQFWDKEEVPRDVLDMMATWQDFNPDWNYQCFNEKQALILLSKFSKRVMAAFLRSQSPAMKSDIFRLVLLYLYGGVYGDADDACTGSLDNLVKLDKSLVLYQEFVGTTGNNFIAAKPKNPIILNALMEATENIIDNSDDNVWFASGPGCISRVLGQSIAEHLQAGTINALDVTVLTMEEAYEYTWMHTVNSYKNSQDHWQKQRK